MAGALCRCAPMCGHLPAHSRGCPGGVARSGPRSYFIGMLDFAFLPARRALLPSTALVVAAWVAACGGGSDGSVFNEATNPNDDGGDGSLGPSANDDAAAMTFGDATTGEGGISVAKALVFDPPQQQLVLDGIAPQNAKFRLRATLLDGSTRYVTAQSLQTRSPARSIPVIRRSISKGRKTRPTCVASGRLRAARLRHPPFRPRRRRPCRTPAEAPVAARPASNAARASATKVFAST